MQKRYGMSLNNSRLDVSFRPAPELVITRLSINKDYKMSIPRKSVTVPHIRRRMIRTLPPLVNNSMMKEPSLIVDKKSSIPTPLKSSQPLTDWRLMQEDV